MGSGDPFLSNVPLMKAELQAHASLILLSFSRLAAKHERL
jgi:hypothetical protein